MSSVALTIATAKATQPQIQALVAGTIAIEDCATTFRVQPDQGALVRAFEPPLADVAELSLSSYIRRKAEGHCPYIALPVFPRRGFPKGSLYIRTDRGIASPGALCDRRVGLTNYNHTAYTWVRAILDEEHGVPPSRVRWVSAPRETSSHLDPVDAAPAGVSITPAAAGKTLAGMLESGEIDAVISPSPLSCHVRGAPGVGRFSRDPLEDGGRAGLSPVLHVLGLRADLAKRHPWVSGRIASAFFKVSTAIPDQDRKALDFFLRHHHAQGLSSRRITVDEFYS
jgi:4,5-dihydroxyphthalate decarboxylase